MTIAEKIVKLNEDADKLIDLNNQLEQALYGTDTGGKSYYDAFWDMFNSKTRQSYLFDQWDSNLFYPKYDLRPTDGTSYMSGMKNEFDLVERLKECGVILDMSQCTDVRWAFSQCAANKYPVIDTTSAPNLIGTFYYSTVLESIEKLILKNDGSQTFGGAWSEAFRECRNLKDIVFEGVIGQSIDFQWSPKLTRASIESIITHLSDTASGKTLTLSKTAVNEAFAIRDEDGYPITWGELTDEWETLVSSKSNWTINLI
jgi:hypothetical protein